MYLNLSEKLNVNDSELKVGWLVSNVRTNDFEELFTTELASSRMRAGVCISGCQKATLKFTL